MSSDQNRIEYDRWMRQAERDLADLHPAKRLDEVYISSRYPNGLEDTRTRSHARRSPRK